MIAILDGAAYIIGWVVLGVLIYMVIASIGTFIYCMIIALWNRISNGLRKTKS